MLLWKRFTELEVTKRLIRKARRYNIAVVGQGKVGATAGWVITGATDIGHATLPASQTSSTLVVPLPPLAIGSKIRGLYACGQVESAGNNAALTLALKKQQNVAAANSVSEVGTKSTGNIAADAVLDDSNTAIAATGGINEEVKAGFNYYALITATTAASTDIDLTHLVLTVDEE